MAAAAIAPRPAMERKSGTLDYSDKYAYNMVRWRDSLMRQGREDLLAFRELQEAERYIDYLEGNWWDPNRPAYRSKFYDNYMADQRVETLAALSDIRPAMDISSRVKAYDDHARGLHAYTKHLWTEDDLDLKTVSWLDHACFGSGFLKQSANYPGDFTFTTHGLDHVIPILMAGNDLQTSAAVVYETPQTLAYFQQVFGPEKCAGLERQATSLSRILGSSEKLRRPESLTEYTWNALSPAMRKRMSMRNGPIVDRSGGYTPFPVLQLQEIYVDDWNVNEDGHDKLVRHPDLKLSEHNYHYIVPAGARLFPRKRLVVFAGDRVMYDGPGPYWHGLYPFTMLQLNPCVWAPGGISKFRDLVPLVRSLNRIGAGVDESVMRALNGTWVAKRGAISEAAWDKFIPGKPSQKVMLNPVAQPHDFREIQAPALPSQVGEFMRYLVETIKRRSGSLDIQGLARKQQVPGGDTVQQMQDAVSGRFRLEGRYVESAIKRAGMQLISNILQFATLDQRLRVLGSDGMTWSDFDYKGGSMVPYNIPQEDFWKMFAFNIAQGSSHGSSKFAKKVEAFNLYKMGGLSLRGLYRQLEIAESYDQNMAELQEEAQSGIGVAGAAASAGRQQRQKRSERNGAPI